MSWVPWAPRRQQWLSCFSRPAGTIQAQEDWRGLQAVNPDGLGQRDTGGQQGPPGVVIAVEGSLETVSPVRGLQAKVTERSDRMLGSILGRELQAECGPRQPWAGGQWL